MLEAIVRHRTDEQLEQSRTDVVVLSCDRFRCDQAMGQELQWEKGQKDLLHVQSRVCAALKSISKLMYIASRVPIRPEMHGGFLQSWRGESTKDFDYISAEEQLCNGSCCRYECMTRSVPMRGEGSPRQRPKGD